jgi:hypothetical protein
VQPNGRGERELGVAAARQAKVPDRRAPDPPRVDARADGVDHSRDLAPGRHGELGEREGEASAARRMAVSIMWTPAASTVTRASPAAGAGSVTPRA